MHAQSQDSSLRTQLLQFVHDVQADASWHADVQEDELPVLFFREVQGLLCGACLRKCCPLKSLGQDVLDSSTEDGVVIGYDNAYHSLAPLFLSRSKGIRMETVVVPPLEWASTRNSPTVGWAPSPTGPTQGDALGAVLGVKPLAIIADPHLRSLVRSLQSAG